MKGERKIIPVSFSKYEIVNNVTAKAKIYVMYPDDNRNGSSMSKEDIEKSISGLYGVPVVGEFSESKEDFLDHGGKIEITSEKVDYITTTKPYGFIDIDPELANVGWETKLDDDGVEREYLVVDAYMWRRMYPELDITFEEGSNHSMEIIVKDGYVRDDGIFQITDFEFDKLCILGKTVEPAFEGAQVVGYSLDKKDFKSQFTNMMTEIKKSFSEGGDGMKNVVEPIVEPVVEPIVEPIVEPVVEPVVEDPKFVVEEPKVVEPVVIEPVIEEPDNKYILKYELSFGDKITKIYQKFGSLRMDVWISSDNIYDEYFIYEEYCEGKYYKQMYSFDESEEIIFDGEREEMFVEFLTESEKSDLEMMRGEFVRLKEFENSINKENELREKENELKEKDELFKKFDEDLNELEEYTKLKENKLDYSLDELESKISRMYTEKNKNFSMNKMNTIVTMGVIKVKNDINENPYGGLFQSKEN